MQFYKHVIVGTVFLALVNFSSANSVFEEAEESLRDEDGHITDSYINNSPWEWLITESANGHYFLQEPETVQETGGLVVRSKKTKRRMKNPVLGILLSKRKGQQKNRNLPNKPKEGPASPGKKSKQQPGDKINTSRVENIDLVIGKNNKNKKPQRKPRLKPRSTEQIGLVPSFESSYKSEKVQGRPSNSDTTAVQATEDTIPSFNVKPEPVQGSFKSSQFEPQGLQGSVGTVNNPKAFKDTTGMPPSTNIKTESVQGNFESSTFEPHGLQGGFGTFNNPKAFKSTTDIPSSTNIKTEPVQDGEYLQERDFSKATMPAATYETVPSSNLNSETTQGSYKSSDIRISTELAPRVEPNCFPHYMLCNPEIRFGGGCCFGMICAKTSFASICLYSGWESSHERERG